MSISVPEELTVLEETIPSLHQCKNIGHIEVKTDTDIVYNATLVLIQNCSYFSDEIELVDSEWKWKYNREVRVPEKVWIIEFTAWIRRSGGPAPPISATQEPEPWQMGYVTLIVDAEEGRLMIACARPITVEGLSP
jgi:hypothetical protein